jgi:dolichol-phosphate mannosyltransferase
MRKLLISPVYNEIFYLGEFYNKVRRHYKGDILFIDDGSSDGCGNFLKELKNKDKNIYLIIHPSREGYGASLIEGFNYLVGKNYDCAVTIDADGQHNPAHLPDFWRELMKNEVVLGSRYLNYTGSSEVPPHRFVINKYVSSLLDLVFNIKFTDPFCGYRGYRASFLKKAKLREKGYGLGLEIILEIIRLKPTFKEIAVELIYNNPERKFLDGLDNPKKRLLYYLDIIEKKKKEMEYESQVFSCQPSSR